MNLGVMCAVEADRSDCRGGSDCHGNPVASGSPTIRLGGLHWQLISSIDVYNTMPLGMLVADSLHGRVIQVRWREWGSLRSDLALMLVPLYAVRRSRRQPQRIRHV